jgi:hypothetical protein
MKDKSTKRKNLYMRNRNKEIAKKNQKPSKQYLSFESFRSMAEHEQEGYLNSLSEADRDDFGNKFYAYMLNAVYSKYRSEIAANVSPSWGHKALSS